MQCCVLEHPILKSSGHDVYQSALAFAFAGFIFVFCSAFFFPVITSTVAYHGAVGKDILSSSSRLEDVLADPSFPLPDFIQEYRAFPESQRFAAKRMSCNGLSVPDAQFQCRYNTVVGAWEER